MKELLLRFMAKEPKLFAAIKWIGVALAIICGVPAWLEGYGVALPETFMVVANKYIGLAGAVSAFISSLTVATPASTQSVLKKIDTGVKAEVASKGE